MSFIFYQTEKMAPERIMVKTTLRSDLLSSAIFCLIVNLKLKCFQIPMLLTFEILERARNHGRKFPKLRPTSVSWTVHCRKITFRLHDAICQLPRWFQVMGIPRKSGQCLAVIYSNIVALNTWLFTRYVRRHPSKKINYRKVTWKAF